MTEKKKARLENLRKSFAAGFVLGIGCVVKLSCANDVVGAALFATGLFAICSFGMNLFTGKVGYIIENKNVPNCLIVWLGNFLGMIFTCGLVRLAKPAIHEKAAALMSAKLEQSFITTAILAFFCGVLMYAAVDNFKRHSEGAMKVAGIFLCVMTFILCGFEHSVANMGYAVLGISGTSEILPYLGYLLICSVSNGLGGIALWRLVRTKQE